MMLGKKPNIYWKVCWLGVSPIAVGVSCLLLTNDTSDSLLCYCEREVLFVLLQLVIIANCVLFKPPEYEEGKVYPGWAISLGWCIALFPMMCIPAWFLGYYCRSGGFDVSKIYRCF